jgi:hypothetical protein
MKEYKSKIILNDKEYDVEVKNGVRFIDGKTVDEFMKGLDTITLLEFAEVGKIALADEKNGTTRSYQNMMNDFKIKRN